MSECDWTFSLVESTGETRADCSACGEWWTTPLVDKSCSLVCGEDNVQLRAGPSSGVGWVEKIEGVPAPNQ